MRKGRPERSALGPAACVRAAENQLLAVVAHRVGGVVALIANGVGRILGVGLHRVGGIVDIRFHLVGGIVVIRLDIVGGLLGRALVARGERADAEGNHKNRGGLH